MATILAIPFGILMNIVPIGGKSVASAASAGGPLALEVAPYAFGIWFLIFLWQLAYMIYQALPSQRENPVLRRVGWWAVANSVAQGLWALAVVNGRYTLAWVLILVMLVSLIAVVAQVGGRERVLSTADRWLVAVPYSINLGWISVATLLSTYSLLFNIIGVGGPFAQVALGVVAVVVAAALGFLMLFRQDNVAYAAVIVWALVGAAVGSAGVPAIARTAAALAVLLAVAILAVLVNRRRA
jgi:hypothetical protein